jgi:hypothetical protein
MSKFNTTVTVSPKGSNSPRLPTTSKSQRPTEKKMVPICIFWCVWKEMNRRCFENLEGSLEEVLESVLLTLYNWSMAFLYPTSVSYADFIVRFSLSN